ncbi:MAG TPA: hypothetical protein VF810_04395, partial [Patescibacteria group bacterium]
MSKKSFLLILFIFFSFFILAKPVQAIENPLTQPNNKIGIHILFPSEIFNAAKLTNSNGGDWGYVTIPIQTNDQDFNKWQNFMYACKKFHIIPILRLATGNDPNNSNVWRKPQLNDVITQANFLNKLDWPVKNRYVIVFNEVNRGNEWGGAANASEYANILSFAVTVFKSKNPDFFIISAGLDNAAPNQGTNYISELDFMKQMHTGIPAIFNQIDGLASHAYPNPGFSQPPDLTNTKGIASFKYEHDLAQTLTGKNLPIFITETGWSADKISDDQKINFYTTTFNNIWTDPNIVAITPFLLEARAGDFQKFSFITASGAATKQYAFLHDLPKTKGIPDFPVTVLGTETKVSMAKENNLKQNPPLNFWQKMLKW